MLRGEYDEGELLRELAVRCLEGTEEFYIHRQDLAERVWRIDRRRVIVSKAEDLLGYSKKGADYGWAEVNNRRYLLTKERGAWRILIGPDDAIPVVNLTQG